MGWTLDAKQETDVRLGWTREGEVAYCALIPASCVAKKAPLPLYLHSGTMYAVFWGIIKAGIGQAAALSPSRLRTYLPLSALAPTRTGLGPTPRSKSGLALPICRSIRLQVCHI